MTKEDMVALLNSAGVDHKVVDAMTQSYEMGFEHGAKVAVHMRDAIEYGISMCEHLDFDEVPSAKKMAENFRRALENTQ